MSEEKIHYCFEACPITAKRKCPFAYGILPSHLENAGNGPQQTVRAMSKADGKIITNILTSVRCYFRDGRKVIQLSEENCYEL